MTIPFFDSNPGILGELRAMDHDSKEYRKLLPKVLLEIGRMTSLFNFLKESEEGNTIRKKYIHSLIVTGVFLLSMFIWIFVAVLLTGKETDQLSGTNIPIFALFIFADIASITLSMVFAFRSRKKLLQGVSFLIDNYNYNNNFNSGTAINTLSNYKFKRILNKKFILSMVILAVAMVVPRIYDIMQTIQDVQPKDFSISGFTITLTKDFQEKDIVSQTATLSSTKYIVSALKEEFQALKNYGISSDITLKEYAQDIINNNSVDTKIEGTENRPEFVYEKSINGKDFKYLAMVFRGSDAFWMVNFACETKNFETSKAQFEKWADTIKIQ